jgi:hypothetical protein
VVKYLHLELLSIKGKVVMVSSEGSERGQLLLISFIGSGGRFS